MNKKKKKPDVMTAYVPKEEQLKLKSKLALKGETISAWVRKQISREIAATS